MVYCWTGDASAQIVKFLIGVEGNQSALVKCEKKTHVHRHTHLFQGQQITISVVFNILHCTFKIFKI